jgi:hypothetical protein
VGVTAPIAVPPLEKVTTGMAIVSEAANVKVIISPIFAKVFIALLDAIYTLDKVGTSLSKVTIGVMPAAVTAALATGRR